MSREYEPERVPLAQGATLGSGMYRIERLLGQGGFALTYVARQGRWNLSVCVKEFFPVGCQRGPLGIEPMAPQFEARVKEGLQAFHDEAASLARFNHPGIVRVLGTFSENRTVYMVQEILEGMTLSDGLSMAGKMKTAIVLKVAQQLGQALLMVHAAGLVHSDLKPENIFLTREGRYVLLDFGLTRGFLSTAGAQIGGRGLTSGFAPPEQYLAGSKLTPASDVYSFAATLYSLLTGMAPPDGHLRRHGQPIPAIKPINPSITPQVDRALQNALHIDPAQRTPGIREFLYQLGLDSTPKAISYRPAEFEELCSPRAHSTGLTALALHSPSQRLYSGGRDGVIKAWSWPDMEVQARLQIFEGPLSRLAVSEDGHYLAIGSEVGEIRLLSSSLDHPGLTLTQEGSAVTSLKFHKNLIAASFVDGRCCLLGPSLPEPVCWIAHAGPANGVDFHPDGSCLVTAGEDKTIRFWDLPQPQMLNELRGHDKGVQSALFSPDGTSLISASNDQTIKFWDLLSHQQIREMRGHQAFVFDARFSFQENLIISLSGDHTLRGFNLSSSRAAFCSDSRNDRTRALVVDPLRPLVATGAGDGSICVWQFENRSFQGTQKIGSLSVPQAPACEDGEDPLIGRSLGRYHIVKRLGSGGMATVYKASVSNSKQAVAIKVIRPDHVSQEFQQRFEREIKLSMKLNHPNVLRTLDWGSQDGLTYLVMELVEGVPLKGYIPPGGLSLEKSTPYLTGIVAGLAHAHSLGIVHRDIKPENVMISHSGEVKLMDFGLARDKEVKTVTKMGSAIGTAEYMAPEQILRGPERSGLTKKTDQYGLGVLIFEVLTGRRPFEWDDPAKLITMHVTQAPPSLKTFRDDIPAPLEEVVARLLSKEVEDRYPSVEEAGLALFAATGR